MKKEKRFLAYILASILTMGSLQVPVIAGDVGVPDSTVYEILANDGAETNSSSETIEGSISEDEEGSHTDSRESESNGVSADNDYLEDPEDVNSEDIQDIQDTTSNDNLEESLPAANTITQQEDEEDVSLNPLQIRAFQEKIKVWKYENQIMIIFDSEEEIQLGYNIYSGVTDELLYSGIVAWDGQSKINYESIDFDTVNNARKAEDEKAEKIIINDIPLRIVFDDGFNYFEESVSPEFCLHPLITKDKSKEGQINISWDSVEKAFGYSVLVKGDTVRVYDTYDNDIIIDNPEDEELCIKIAAYLYDDNTNTKQYFLSGFTQYVPLAPTESVVEDDVNGEEGDAGDIASLEDRNIEEELNASDVPEADNTAENAIEIDIDQEETVSEGSMNAASFERSEYKGHTYQLFNEGVTWSTAKSRCKGKGGHLVTVSSAGEYSFCKSLLGNMSPKYCWMGATHASGAWKWITGESWGFTAWSPNQPNGSGGGTYALMQNFKGVASAWNWDDQGNSGNSPSEKYQGAPYYHLTKNYCYICEWEPTISISLNNKDLEQKYTGKAIKPVPIVKNGNNKLLIEGSDYTLSYSNNVVPGTATITATGLGDYAGKSASVTFLIKTEVSVDIEESEIIALPNKEIVISAKIVSPYVEPVSSDIKWGVSSSDDIKDMWEKDSITKCSDTTYIATHSYLFNNPGTYIISVNYLGFSDNVKIRVVVPQISVEMGPHFNNGSLVCDDIKVVDSFCDVRYVVSFEKEGISAPGLLREFLSDVTFNKSEVEANKVVIYSEKIEISEDGKKGAKVLRIGPSKAIVKDCVDVKITFKDQLSTEIEKNFQIRDGVLFNLVYRADNKDKNGDKYSYNDCHTFFYSDKYFYKDASIYNNNLAVMTLGLEMSSFTNPDCDSKYGEITNGKERADNILDAYRELCYYPDNQNVYNYNVELSNSSNKVAFTIASKYIASKETDDTLITVVLRGGGYGAEWASNFNVGETGDSKGFSTAADYVFLSLEDYLFQLKEEDKIIGDVKLLITGFSRSAAVANLLSHRINNAGTISGCAIDASNNYTYTFATPAGHYGKASADKNIFNIVSENDLVPKIPFEKWGFHRYGKDIVLPESTPEAVKQSFYNYTGIVFNASNEKAFEGWFTDTILKISPDRKNYVKNLQYYITAWEKIQFKDIKGSFTKGLIGGVINAFVEKYSIIDSSKGKLSLDTLSWLKEIIALFGYKEKIEVDTRDVILKGLEVISDEQFVFDMELVHYPEHYLAWLESGGIFAANDKDTFSNYSDTKKAEIANSIIRKIGNKVRNSSYKSAVVSGTTKVSAFDSDGNLIVSTASGVKENGGVFIFSNDEENNAFVLIPANMNVSLVVEKREAGNIDLRITENTGTENSRTLTYKDIFLDISSSVSIKFVKGITSVGDTFPVTREGIVIEPTSDYKSAEESFFVEEIPLSSAAVTGISNRRYTGKALKPVPTVTVDSSVLELNRDYTLTYSNNTNAGTATITITGIGNYVGSITASFKINKASQLIKVASAASSIAVGKTTKVSITGAKGKKSFKSSNNSIATVNASTGVVTAKKVGKATITVASAATSNYNAASKTVLITVVPKATAVSKLKAYKGALKIYWNKQASQTTGYEVQLSIRKDFVTHKSVFISKTSTTSKKVTGLKKKRKYYVRVRTYKRTGGKTYYSSWSSTKTITTK